LAWPRDENPDAASKGVRSNPPFERLSDV
jgi:hypothetical protein